MQLFSIPRSVFAIFVFTAITVAGPIPQDVPPPCIILPFIQTNYPKHQLVTSSPSNSTVDGKDVYIPSRFGIPESPPPVPLVIYSSTIPSGTNILTATLKDSALYGSPFPTPARVAAADTKGLSSVFFQGGFTPTGTDGEFQVQTGCDIKGRGRVELWPTQGQFCVRKGEEAPELEIMIKAPGYVAPKPDPNPCVDVTLEIRPAH